MDGAGLILKIYEPHFKCGFFIWYMKIRGGKAFNFKPLAFQERVFWQGAFIKLMAIPNFLLKTEKIQEAILKSESFPYLCHPKN
jgi:hypothetical protein